jgi:spore coat polysaccharide biosynthesis predicted glycosyltransferase SpsG
MPNVLFRADAEKSIGVGDLMSLIYLADEFRRNSWKCFFAVRDYPPALAIIKGQNLKSVYLIPCRISVRDEMVLLRKICKDTKIDCLVMEVTKNSLREYKDLGKPAHVKACINFDGIITDDFDIVVNWCVSPSDDLYGSYSGKNIQFVLGFKNTILPPYLDWKKISRKDYQEKTKKILISMGGIDGFDMTAKIIKALAAQRRELDIRVIVGPGYERYGELSRFACSKFKKFSLKYNSIGLFKDYLWADIAFSAGGLTSSELVATKTPAILIATYEHQIKRCKYYSSRDWAYYAGYHETVGEEGIIKSLDHITGNINLFRESLSRSNFKGGNEKIYKRINSCRQSRQLV